MLAAKFTGIDHFHLYVDDKQKAVKWYQQVLGFKVVDSLQFLLPNAGPLTIADESKTIHLALFTRQD
ncbi:VOC family protein [Aliikangiella sp. IMCC44632]